MSNFKVPLREEVSAINQGLFDKLTKAIGFVPNLYALMATSDTMLDAYLKFENASVSLSSKEVELIKLVVSQVNGCRYCLSAHTEIGKMNGFSTDEMLEIRNGHASFNSKLNALAKITREITINKGHVSDEDVQQFLSEGYPKSAFIEIVHLIGVMTVTNFLHNLTQIPIDFPIAPLLEDLKVKV